MGANIKMGGGGGRRRRQKHVAMSEINVTPFVDVMLVLLIIFMVTAPLMATGVPIDLPKVGAPQLQQSQKEPLQIKVTKSGEIFIGAEEKVRTTLDELKVKLPALAQAHGTDDALQIHGSSQVPYGELMKVVTEVTKAGFRKIVFRTDPEAGG